MQVPVEIAFRHCEPSGEIRSEVDKQVRRLEKFSPRVTSCRVVVTGPQTRRRRGGLFEVELRIAMPEHMATRPSMSMPWSQSGMLLTRRCAKLRTSRARCAIRGKNMWGQTAAE